VIGKVLQQNSSLSKSLRIGKAVAFVGRARTLARFRKVEFGCAVCVLRRTIAAQLSFPWGFSPRSGAQVVGVAGVWGAVPAEAVVASASSGGGRLWGKLYEYSGSVWALQRCCDPALRPLQQHPPAPLAKRRLASKSQTLIIVLKIPSLQSIHPRGPQRLGGSTLGHTSHHVRLGCWGLWGLRVVVTSLGQGCWQAGTLKIWPLTKCCCPTLRWHRACLRMPSVPSSQLRASPGRCLPVPPSGPAQRQPCDAALKKCRANQCKTVMWVSPLRSLLDSKGVHSWPRRSCGSVPGSFCRMGPLKAVNGARENMTRNKLA